MSRGKRVRRQRRRITVGLAFLRWERHAMSIVRGRGVRSHLVRRSVHGAVRRMRRMRVRDGRKCAWQASLSIIGTIGRQLWQLAVGDDGVPVGRQRRLRGVGGSTLVGRGATLKRSRERAPWGRLIYPRVTRRTVTSFVRGYSMMHRGGRTGICGQRGRFLVCRTDFHDRESTAAIRNSSSSHVRRRHSIRWESHAIRWTW